MPSVRLSKLISRTWLIIRNPTMTSAGAVAWAGTIPTIGEKKTAAKNSKPIVTDIKPVRPPSATPLAASMYMVLLEAPHRPPQMAARESMNSISRHFGVRLTDLQSKRRSQSITTPRQICMYLARNLTKHSLEEIGGHLGGRDHTTVMHACGKIAEAKASDPKMDAMLEELTKQITQAQPV